MPTPLLTTKFFIPPAPANDLLRQRLFDLADDILSEGRRLALVCAPAGYGKTTLVADWIRRARQSPAGRGLAAAWLSLDESENDPQQFWLYFIASVQRALPGDEELALLLESLPSAGPQSPLAGLVNRLAAWAGPVVLVLDDYQVIHTPAIHNDLAFLIEHLPPNAHLVITTRSDPSLPLHRFRARGQVLEIRMDALRLTGGEVSDLLDRENRPDLGAEEAGILVERTEGWPAGIHMAMLSLRGRADAGAFIHSWGGGKAPAGTPFRGYILDYLAEEVLKAQPGPVQRFLVQTAILDRMCAELCEEVVGRSGIGQSGTDWKASSPITDPLITDHPLSEPDQSILNYLFRSNLFLIPLDEEGHWFRYHHLFLDLLRMRLKQVEQRDPEMVMGLHRRAAGWLEANGWLREAIQHAIAAGDYPTAARMVEQHTIRLFAEGELHALVSWVRLLPPDLARSRPWLSIYQAWAMGFAGELAAARQLCESVEGLLSVIPDEERRALEAELIGIHALTDLMAGDVGRVLPLETLPAETFPPGREFARSAVWWALGFAWRILGELSKAIAAFEEMRRIGQELGNNWTILSAAVDLGNTLRQAGRLRDTEAAYRDGLRRIQDTPAIRAGFVGRLESFLANTLYEKNDLDEAARLALSSIRHNRYWDNANHTAHAYYTLARIHLGQQDLPAAAEALDESEKAAGRPGVVASLKAIITALRVRLWLAQGLQAEADRWLESDQTARRWLEPNPPGSTGPAGRATEMDEVLAIAAARVLLAGGDDTRAANLLARIEAPARSAGHHNALIELLALKALALRGPVDDPRPAGVRDAVEAVALGGPQGYTRVFLDEGEAMCSLLAEALAWLKRERPADLETPRLAGFITALLSQFPAPAQEEAADSAEAEAAEAKAAKESLLTGRELEILRAIAAGLTNQQIGLKLYISTGTVKAHSATIYRKLDVANRTEAIARAKDLGLL